MTEPIRVLHFADAHIGMENYGKTDPATGLSTRVMDFLRRLDEMTAYAESGTVDLVIFAGDAFKTRQPNPTFQREFAHRVRDLSRLAPVALLVGNHDLPPTQLKASSIEIYDTLRVPNVYVLADYALTVIETRRGPVAVASAPYPIRSRLLEDDRAAGLTIAETDALLQNRLSAILDELAAQADALPLPRLLTGHFTVSGAVYGSERSIMLGRDVMVPLSAVADPRWDYVALGHIHRFQNLTEGQVGVPPVVYSGSIERIDFGEEADTKGFCWVELARGAARWQFVTFDAISQAEDPEYRPRRFVTLKANLTDSDDPTQDVIRLMARDDLRAAVVRLILDLSPETDDRLSEQTIRDEGKRRGVFQLLLQKTIAQTTRLRLGDSPEGLTPAELLERYLIARETLAERRAELLAAAQPLFEAAE